MSDPNDVIMTDISEFERCKREYINRMATNFQIYELSQSMNKLQILCNTDVQMTDVGENNYNMDVPMNYNGKKMKY